MLLAHFARDLVLTVAHGLPVGDVSLNQPVTGVHELHNVDDLLQRHDGEGYAGDHPGPPAVDLVSASHLQSSGTPRAGEDTSWGRARLDGSLGRFLKEGRREGRG